MVRTDQDRVIGRKLCGNLADRSIYAAQRAVNCVALAGVVALSRFFELVGECGLPESVGCHVHRVEGDRSHIQLKFRRERVPALGLLRDIAFGPFETHVPLRLPFDRDGVSAHLEDGLLEVRLPKRQPVRVEVETE